MKRLIRKAFGKILYHGTTLENFKSIIAAGMISPQESGGAGIYDSNFNLEYPSVAQRNFEGFVFLTIKEYNAREYAVGELGNYASGDVCGVVIEVDVPESSILPDDSDIPEARTWQESSSIGGQVKILGPVTTDYFRDIHFYNAKLELKIFTAQLNNWEQKFEENKDLILVADPEDEKMKEFLKRVGGIK